MILFINPLRKLAALGAIALISLAIAGMVLIVSDAGTQGGMARPLLMVRPLAAPETPQAPAGAAAAPAPRSNPPAPRQPGDGAGDFRSGGGGRLAVVIDDIGYNLSVPREYLALGLPLTFSVLPDLEHSREAVALIRKSGREFLVHLPMEPLRYPEVDPGPGPLLLSHGADATRRRLEGYFLRLPGAIGASNHMGSAYTSDAEKMQVVQAVVAQQGRVFLNSLTSNSSVPRRIAGKNGFRYLERNIFLDNVREEGAIRRQLARAMRIARRRGRAIAIGHPYGETRRVLAARFPTPQAENVRLVPLSSLFSR